MTDKYNEIKPISIGGDVVEVGNFGLLQLDEFDSFILNLPPALDQSTTQRLILELPNRILFLDNQVNNQKKLLADAKTSLNTQKKLWELEKSEIRKKEMDVYFQEVKEYQIKSKEIMSDVMSSGENASLKKTYLQEMLKIYSPVKPSKSDLDDMAIVQTAHIQDEIEQLENQITEHNLEIEILNTKKDFYNNVFITIRKYVSILVEEIRRQEK